MHPDKRALWELLFADKSQFYDYRHAKADKGGNGPDFRHKDSEEGLWWVNLYTSHIDFQRVKVVLP